MTLSQMPNLLSTRQVATLLGVGGSSVKRWADRGSLDEAREVVRREVDEAVEWADNSPYPDPSELCEHVYDEA